MPTYNIVVFAGDYAGPEVSLFLDFQERVCDIEDVEWIEVKRLP